MNLSVSRLNGHGRFLRSIVSILGLLQGGEFVTARARATIQGASGVSLIDPPLNPQPERLKGSRFTTPEDLGAFAQKFDEGVKRLFSSDQATQYVKFGGPRDNDPGYGVRAGRLTLTG